MNVRNVSFCIFCMVILTAQTVKGENGPTIALGYSADDIKKNPVPAFMYFVPLISPVPVQRETSADNNEMGWVVSYNKKDGDSKTFYASCEFKMVGKGFHTVIFDHNGMIVRNTDDLQEGRRILDYIRFDGQGTGLFEVSGTITDSNETVMEVDVSFNYGDEKSPVSVGLYNVKLVDGKYKYENRYDELIARVNKLVFKRTDGDPRLEIVVASVRKKTDEEGIMSNFVGMIANFFIKPLAVDKKGNDAMLDFGYAMFKKKPQFTFPKAANINKDITVK
jgi:hypothetical protein